MSLSESKVYDPAKYSIRRNRNQSVNVKVGNILVRIKAYTVTGSPKIFNPGEWYGSESTVRVWYSLSYSNFMFPEKSLSSDARGTEEALTF